MDRREITGCQNCEECVGCVDMIVGAECGALPFEEEFVDGTDGDDPFDEAIRENIDARRRLMNEAGRYAQHLF